MMTMIEPVAHDTLPTFHISALRHCSPTIVIKVMGSIFHNDYHYRYSKNDFGLFFIIIYEQNYPNNVDE